MGGGAEQNNIADALTSLAVGGSREHRRLATSAIVGVLSDSTTGRMTSEEEATMNGILLQGVEYVSTENGVHVVKSEAVDEDRDK